MMLPDSHHVCIHMYTHIQVTPHILDYVTHLWLAIICRNTGTMACSLLGNLESAAWGTKWKHKHFLGFKQTWKALFTQGIDTLVLCIVWVANSLPSSIPEVIGASST